TGLSGVGPLVLVDNMEVTAWDPPHRFAVAKLGPVLAGGGRVVLEPSGAGTRLVWQEEIVLRPSALGRRLGRLTDPVTRWLFTRALDAMTARVTAGCRSCALPPGASSSRSWGSTRSCGW